MMTTPTAMFYSRVLYICLLPLLASCAGPTPTAASQASQLNAVPQQPDWEMKARILSLEHDVQRVKNEVVRLESEHYIDRMSRMLNAQDCEFVVSTWADSEATLNGFLNDSAGMRRGFGASSPDPRIAGGIKRLVYLTNKTCKSNLVFNAKPD